MPFRLQTSSDPNNPNWKNPAAISIYDNGWKTTKVGYVYDMGWKVVYPDPIIPNITINNYLIGARQSVYVDVLLTNCDYIIAELYSGTTQTNLLDTQTIETLEDVFDSERITFAGLANNTTYNMKITAYSITENTYTVLTGSATTTNVIIPTASITSITNVSLNGVTVNWNSTNQYYWNIEIYRTSDGSPLTSRNPGPPPEPIFGPDDRSWTASFNAIANTQYTVKLTVESISEDPAVSFSTFTTPNVIQPTLSSLTATSTCNSITVNWSGSNYVSGIVQLWFPDLQLPSQQWTWGSLQRSSSFTSSTLSSYTFNGLPSSTLYVARIILVSSTSTELDSDSVFTWPSGSTSGPGNHPFISTLAPSVNAPTNFTATSNFYGNGATLSWTAAVGSCTSVTGYNVQYKLSSSGTWLALVNGITGTSVNTTLYVTLTANTSYDFRVLATSSAGNSGYATTTITTNNNVFSISLTPATATTTTFSSLGLTVQLKNVSGNNVSQSGVTVNWSSTALTGTSLAQSSTTTNSSGQATNTLNTGAFNGQVDITAVAAITINPSAQSSVIVALSPALNPSLSSTRTTFGYDVTHSNYNSSWSYSGTVSNGGFNFDGVWGDGFYTIVIPPLNTAAPVASRNALVSVTCTSGTWTAQPSATTRVTSTRQGYFAGIGEVTNSPTGTLSFSYTWYFGNGAVAGSGQTLSITSAMRGRNMYCIVVATRTGGIQGFQAQSNTIAIPA